MATTASINDPMTMTVATAWTSHHSHMDDDDVCLQPPTPLSIATTTSTYSLQKHNVVVHTHLHNQWCTGHDCGHVVKS